MARITALFALLVLCIASVSAQTKISGKVLDGADPNNGLPGVSIVEEGTTNGTITDFNGVFSITLQSRDASLGFSYIGYVSQVLPAQDGMTVVLEEEYLDLDDIVVVGYQTQKKADLTGSVSVVSTDALKTASDSDPMRALQGKVAGMTVTTDGSPAGTGCVRIRGIGSFNSSQDPLYVIDGVPTTMALNTLNANDIESMQVLKDAASASIYGSRAANGVIIITTKQGKKGDKLKVEASANITSQFYTSQSLMSLCNTQEYATAMVQAALNDGVDPVAYARNYGLDINSADGVSINVYDPASGSMKNYKVNGAYDGFINSKKTMEFSDTDWLDAISRTGIQQTYDISVSNASEAGTSMFSLGYKKNQGILKHTWFESLSGRLNNTYNISNYVSVGENVTVSHSSNVSSAPMENALKMAPTVPLYENDGVTFSGPVGGMSDRQNPLRELAHNKSNVTEQWRVFGNGHIDIKPIEGLLLRSNFGVDFTSTTFHYRTYTFHSDVVNNDTPRTETGHNNDLAWTWSNTANYNFIIADVNNVTILAGLELMKEKFTAMSNTAQGYDVETEEYMWPNAATGAQKAYGSQTGYALASFFGKLDYNYNDLVLASFTFRRDGSSRFGKNNRYGVFPAATLGYRLSNNLEGESISDLKIRASWGKTGNQAIDNLARYSIFVADYGGSRETQTSYDINLQGTGTFPSGFRTTQTGNNNLKWEAAQQTNIGVDFALFNSSLYGSADFYVKKVEDMLISPAYLASVGEGGNSWSNGPSLENKGFECVVGYRSETTGGFKYDVTFNGDLYRNTVTYLPETTKGSYVHTSKENLVQAKRPYGSVVGYVANGLFKSQDEVDASGQENARLGGLKYADLDGNGIINSDDQTWIMNPVPDFSYGVNIQLGYKNFDATVFMQGVAGVQIYNNQKFQTDFWSLTDAGSNKGSRVCDAWTPMNPNSDIPALTTDNRADEGRASTYFVENGSYLKLRTVQIGYNLPSSVIEKLHMKKFRLYASGNNLATIKSSSLTCADPENGSWAYPHSTSISFGLQLTY